MCLVSDGEEAIVKELVTLVSDKAGISESSAEKAVELVLEYLEEKLPSSVAKQLRAYLDNPDIGDQAGNVLKGLGGMLGND